jgi:hypothetical protein
MSGSSEGREYEKGEYRAKHGIGNPDVFFESNSDRAARQRGYEATKAAMAAADAIGRGRSAGESRERSPVTSTRSSSSSSGGSDSATGLVIGAAVYLGLVAGAFVLIQKVATWSLVWWLCALMIVAGIPVYIALAYAAFWLMVALFGLLVVVLLIDHFSKNLY